MKKPSAAVPSTDTRRYCGIKPVPPRNFGPEVGPERASLILMSAKKWVNGTELEYAFYNGPESQKRAMRKAFKVWSDVGIGLTFREAASPADAEVRIAFEDDGSWSYIGRDVLTIPKDQPTMNIGWDISSELDTGIHEIGHTLGFPHEHQNPHAGIVWDEEAVYADLGAPPNNWNRDKTFHNIIRKIDPDTVQGSTWDPDSVMHYPFKAGLILEPPKYRTGLRPAGGLSARDRQWVKTFYPPLSNKDYSVLDPFVSVDLKLAAGKQANYYLKPRQTRAYNMSTFGPTDSVMVLFEERGKKLIYLAGDDDSGTDKNAAIRVRLEKDKQYVLRVRVMFADASDGSAIMYW